MTVDKMCDVEVRHLLDQYDTNGEDEIGIKQFVEIMTELEEAGWKRVTQRQANQMKKSDMRAIFNLVDGDKGVLNN